MSKSVNFASIESCRVCGSSITPVLSLGSIGHTGYFPSTPNEELIEGPLDLVCCTNADCNLVQLGCNYDLNAMYGSHYGYLSSLNSSMVSHLKSKVDKLSNLVDINNGDIICDIGSNDGTTLNSYHFNNARYVGFDPSAEKLRDLYFSGRDLVADFFSKELFCSHFGTQEKAKIVTSFSMFYDLPDPVQFACDVSSILDPEVGVWCFEQSYLPFMLQTNSFDTICHEHLEYYGLKQINYILEKADLRIIDVEFNSINGGSISIIACTSSCKGYPNPISTIKSLIDSEVLSGYDSLDVYKRFLLRITSVRDDLKDIVKRAKHKGLVVCGLGASTKGNTLLQYFGLDSTQITAIGEVNAEKFGKYTPSTNIPIIEEDKVLEIGDIFIVLPWHFKDNFLSIDKFKGKKLLFPLPYCHIVSL